MHEDVVRSIKAEMLREAAAEFRRKADAGDDPHVNILSACMLEQRADRIAAGEEDHSDIPVDIRVTPSEETDDERPPAEDAEPKAG